MTVRGCQCCRDCQQERPRTAPVIAWVNDNVSPQLERITLVAELREWIAANRKPWDRSDTFNFQSNIPSPTLALHGSAEWMAWFEAFAEAKGVMPGTLVDLALAALADKENFQPPPTR